LRWIKPRVRRLCGDPGLVDETPLALAECDNLNEGSYFTFDPKEPLYLILRAKPHFENLLQS